ncbi:MAG: hypothetical protein HFG12_03875 [Oscillibacter sp.]|nr:hypothetical protein [uncultured Oscillibacter sp.]MCI8812367.1 hypothetical protein [Oscillibacter sp.]
MAETRRLAHLGTSEPSLRRASPMDLAAAIRMTPVMLGNVTGVRLSPGGAPGAEMPGRYEF